MQSPYFAFHSQARPLPRSDLGGIQTHDLRNRNPTFYSAKLRGLKVDANVRKKLETCKQRKETNKIKAEERNSRA